MALLPSLAMAAAPTEPTLPDTMASGGGKRVFVLPIHGPVNESTILVFRGAFREAEQAKPDAIIIDLDTSGGGLKETREILSSIRAQRKNCPVYTFVSREATSTGAIISLATNAIYMAPASTIGDAMPIIAGDGGGEEVDEDAEEKIRAYARGWVRRLAYENGYDGNLAEAMVDPDNEFKVGETVVCASGKLLTLTANEAVRVIPPNTKPLLATAIVKDLPELLAKVGLAGAEVLRFEEESTATVGSGVGKRVFVLPIHGPIDKTMLFVFRRAFREAEQTSPDAIIIDLDTPGGGLTQTREIISWIRSQRARSPIYAFVNSEAISAGAIISLGTNAIYMTPTSYIGDAMPIMIGPNGVKEMDKDFKEKIRSYTRGWVRGLAQENGYNEDLAQSMVDPKKEFKIGETVICPVGELLTLTANEAIRVIAPNTKPLLATAIVKDLPELLGEVGLAGAEVVRFEEQSADRIARWITLIGPLLFAIGMIGIYIEIRTPGFGVPGIVGAVCLGIYFFGHNVAGLAGWEEVTLIMVGLVLIALEVFIIPGFGIAGIAGIACLVAGSFMAVVPNLPPVTPLEGIEGLSMTPYLNDAMVSLAASFALIAFLAWLMGKILPKTPMYSALVLDAGLSNEKGYVASDVGYYETFLNREGVSRTMLRPAGSAEFGDQRLDVVSDGDLVPKGSRVRVICVDGGRVVVERIEDAPGEG